MREKEGGERRKFIKYLQYMFFLQFAFCLYMCKCVNCCCCFFDDYFFFFFFIFKMNDSYQFVHVFLDFGITPLKTLYKLIVDLFVAQQNCLELILNVVDIDLIWIISESIFSVRILFLRLFFFFVIIVAYSNLPDSFGWMRIIHSSSLAKIFFIRFANMQQLVSIIMCHFYFLIQTKHKLCNDSTTFPDKKTKAVAIFKLKLNLHKI